MSDHVPRQWEHYPHDDAINADGRFQWFYHSHSVQDRPDSKEHGHIHVFARRRAWAHRLNSRAQRHFDAISNARREEFDTRHLIAVSLDAKGIPTGLFTVNSWVTGDLMLNASLTRDLIRSMILDTGHGSIDRMLCALFALYETEIEDLMYARDRALKNCESDDRLADVRLEVLSDLRLDIDRKIFAP